MVEAPCREALRLANDVRLELGLSPRPKLTCGYRTMPDYCPIAQTIRAEARGLRVECDEGRIDIWVGRSAIDAEPDHSWAVNGAVSEFIESFDRGEFPELVEEIVH